MHISSPSPDLMLRFCTFSQVSDVSFMGDQPQLVPPGVVLLDSLARTID